MSNLTWDEMRRIVESEMAKEFPDLTPPEPKEAALDLSQIENALLTIAESIKCLADAYTEVNKPPEKDEFVEASWRQPLPGDYIRLTGRGSTLAARHTGEIVRVVSTNNNTHNNTVVHFSALDGSWSSQSDDFINSEPSRFAIMEKI